MREIFRMTWACMRAQWPGLSLFALALYAETFFAEQSTARLITSFALSTWFSFCLHRYFLFGESLLPLAARPDPDHPRRPWPFVRIKLLLSSPVILWLLAISTGWADVLLTQLFSAPEAGAAFVPLVTGVLGLFTYAMMLVFCMAIPAAAAQEPHGIALTLSRLRPSCWAWWSRISWARSCCWSRCKC